MGGICDEKQRLCFALALWNGVDPILKERAFGLTGNQGNHGEDVKEFYFYLDAVPGLDNRELNLNEISILISERLSNIFRRNKEGLIPAFSQDSPFQNDPHWKDLRLFNEYFHGETGRGLGVAHQTGWIGLVANLISRHYRKDIPVFWQRFWGQIKYTG